MGKRKDAFLTPLEDDEIIELYWQRNEAAIAETDLKYRKYLFIIAYNILNEKLDCEECLNDTYLGAWNAIPPTRPNVLKAFLTTIIRRTAMKRYQHKNRQRAVPSEMTVSLSELEAFVSGDGDVGADFDAERLGKIISDFVRSLGKRRQFIFMSRYYAADSIDVIARDLKLSRSMINKELAAIRSDLAKTLEKEGYSI
jgi:RNA polymerase sigma-70 factor (ECF subfamily)